MMNKNDYFNRVYGGWLGKCLGGAAGAPVEGIKKLLPYKDYKEMIRPDLPNDDLDLQLLWFEVMEEKGLSVTSKDLADAWEKHCWYPFNEYGIFLKNYERGIFPPYSGRFNNPVFSEGEGCPIRSEIWGMLFPGQPQKAAEFAKIDGCLDHTDNAVWIEQYYAAMESSAFFIQDIQKLITQELSFLPEASKARSCVEDVLKWHKAYPDNWEKARTLLMRKYAHFDFTNAVVNLGIVIIALLYGDLCLDTVINIAFRCGFDTDCTCATAGAVWGVMHGESAIPKELKALVNDTLVIGIDVKRDNLSIKYLAEDTCRLAEKLADEKTTDKKITLDVLYNTLPSIGFEDTCHIQIKISNPTDQEIYDHLTITNLPDGWNCIPDSAFIHVQPENELFVDFEIATDASVKTLQNTNFLTAKLGNVLTDFGIAGASEWTAIGPYFDALEKEDTPGLPSAHGENCNLPTLECMVNNAACLSKEYIDESNFIFAFQTEETCPIHGYEDLLPLDDAFPFQGQGCIYLKQELIVKEAETVWVVIGNNDGFRLWVNDTLQMERDEIRLWTPYNNYQLIPLNQGKNQIVLKLLRRTESLKFSLAFRKYEGEHFHRKRWCIDMACEK